MEGETILVNRIAYVSPGGSLFTVDPDGSGLSQLTGSTHPQVDIPGFSSEGDDQPEPQEINEYHTWPTWSADGTKLAASKVMLDVDGTDVSVEVMDARTGESETVYENGLAGLVAEGAPHYIYWAPTGDRLSFLASTPEGLSLFVWDGRPGNPVNLVDRGAPLYYQWSPDAQAMAIHLGPDIIWAKTPGEDETRETFRSPANFRTPAISPDGQSMAYVDEADFGLGLFISPTNDLNQSNKIIDVGPNSAVMWSPDGAQLAVADQSNPRTPLFDRLMLVPVDGGPVTTLTSGNNPSEVWAFFWSPSGDKLAWVAVNPEEQELEWVVSASDGSDDKRLLSFQPSSEMFIMLSFFDQYAYSHSPWSPDGKSLVMAGTKGKVALRSNGRTPTGDRIYVLDVEGIEGPRDLGAGVLAVWSWN
ncbi:MAG: PD40 domain-containing protein [Chloroflexi bacterium]|nr:PD40 domain-containing protein [Chloroflexota bacterium]